MIKPELPPFPWDELAEYGRRAEQHGDGVVNLSIGTPVDPVPANIQAALRDAADSPGYPLAAGSPRLREAISGWLGRHVAPVGADAVIATIGSKELVAWLPTLLGVGSGETIAIPDLAYPTYEVGARMVGAAVSRVDPLKLVGSTDPAPAVLWLNSPSNPTGKVLAASEMAEVVHWARDRGVVVVSDECYLGLGWETTPVSVLDPAVCGGSHDGLLAVHSLSKRSNLAGYRAGFVAGDPRLVAELLAVRKHLGMMVPSAVQAAMVVALDDAAHAAEQRERYAARRTVLREAVAGAGFRIDHSEAGLYLWVTRDEDCWQTVEWFADRGIVVAPGQFYGPTGSRHVRIALTASGERIEAAANRLRV